MTDRTITNPIIKGFNPDPSIVRVGDDYYIATSTFEWFPGVQIHHSRDLAHWRLVDHGLKDRVRLDLMGVPDSGGIWAPSLSWADGKFYLVYTIMRTWGMGRPFKDHHNYLITAESIHGPWSEPVFLNSSGFDASLFHDEGGRKWITNIQWDFRKGQPRFGGILLQEFDAAGGKLIGPVHTLLKKDVLIEGPNLYKRDGFYYLMLAEGGTGWNHSISMARSRSISGPYEVDPEPTVLTARDDDAWPLQKAGHGELVETPSGEWYLVHLASRPLGRGDGRRCMLGRETCLQKVEWREGWLRLAQGGVHPDVSVPAPASLAPSPWPEEPARDDFDAPELGRLWSALRVPIESSWATTQERPGWLRLRGRECLHSWHEQSLVAKRLESIRFTAETSLEFEPEHFTQMAGLICYYDIRKFYYLRVTLDANGEKALGIVLTDDGAYDELLDSQVVIKDWPRVWLRAEIDSERLQFSASADGSVWQPIGPVLDASKLSDDYGQGLHFTGAFVGLCAQDLRGTRIAADFDYFEIRHKSPM